MNRFIKVFSIFYLMFLVGCSKESYKTCSINLNNETQEYELRAVYKIYYDDSYVTRIEKKEVYTSDNKDTLKYFEEYKNLEYSDLNQLYGGYEYNVDVLENQVVLNSDIDVSIVDLKKMVSKNYLSSDYVVSSKLLLTGIKYFYESKGASCDI